MSRGKREASADVVAIAEGAPVDATENRMLAVRLTPEERELRGKRIAALVIEGKQAEEDMAAVRAQHNAAKKERIAEISALADALRTGEEEREVAVREEKHFDRSLIVVRRLDTAEVVETRPMTLEDKMYEGQLS